jgi:hypothetical protein
MEDKENCRPIILNKQASSSSSSSSMASGKSGFGRLLKEVTTQMTMESDEKLALGTQMAEATNMARMWVQEEKGRQFVFVHVSVTVFTCVCVLMLRPSGGLQTQPALDRRRQSQSRERSRIG